MGDLFGTKGDYELGLLYASRRKFLVSAGKNVLEPPTDFKTKKQAHRNYLQNVDENTGSSKKCMFDSSHASDYGLKSPVKHNNNAPKRKDSIFMHIGSLSTSPTTAQNPAKVFSGPKKFKKTAQFVVEAVILEQHLEEESNHEWKEELVAGVHMWTNRFTGEVTIDCPWHPKKALLNRSISHKRLIATPNNKKRDPYTFHENDEYGTGSLVYDPSEASDLFRLLEK